MAALIKTSILVTQERGLFQLFCLMFVFEQTFEEKSQPMMFLSRFFQMIDAQQQLLWLLYVTRGSKPALIELVCQHIMYYFEPDLLWQHL